jgi:GT2 family glycosyltransferase
VRALTRLSVRREAQSPPGRRIPLASLRARSDTQSPSTEWKIDPDGVRGRALEVEAERTITYPLTLTGETAFTAQVMLYPHDWRDLAGAVRAAVSVTTPDGVIELWGSRLRAGDRGRPAGHRVHVSLPAGTTELHLAVQPLRTPPPDAVQRAIWVAPALWDPDWPAAPEQIPAPVAPLSTGGGGPLFSVLVPVHDPPPHMLAEAIESVGNQTLADWELCLVDDGSRDPAVIAALDAYTVDPRIHLHRHPVAEGISAATNAALANATGRYVVLLDHDDTLAPDALEQIAGRIAADPELDMIYTDEDIVQDGAVLEPHPKPGWSPDHMAALMYTCHLGAYRRELVSDLGGFRSRFDGCQDFDLVLRLMERTDRIAHIPRVLYHWRAHPASTATFGGGAKPHAFLAQPATIAEHLARTGVDADVRFGYLQGIHRIVHRVDPEVPVAIAIAVRGTDGLASAARSWLAQSHPAWRLVLAAPAELQAPIARVLDGAGLDRSRFEVIPGPEGGDVATRLVLAAGAAAEGDDAHVLLLQAPAAGLTHDWLTRLIGYAMQPGVAAVGPILLAPDGRMHSAGIALPEGVPLHVLQGLPTVAAPPAVTNPSALSGALLTPTAALRELGGLDPALGELALIHFCLRANEAGGRVVLVPDARLKTTSADHVTNDLPALRAIYRHWADHHGADAFFNAGYLTDRGDLAMR